ncbi:MAG: DUF4062 domain-containing protein [Terriglobales bacterium]
MPLRVFVSSAVQGLENHRRAVIRGIRRNDDVLAMEDFTADSRPPLEVCLSKLQESADLVVLILGERYGTVSPTGHSFTEEEYQCARNLGIPVLAFRFAALAETISAANCAEDEAKYTAFLEQISADHYYEEFTGPEDLANSVLSAITRYKSEHGELGRRLPPLVGWEDYYFRAGNRFLQHKGIFVGRQGELAALRGFVNSHGAVCLLIGASGSGKSRLALELAREGVPRWRFLILRDGAAWGESTVRAIPPTSCVLVIEDANRRDDLEGALDLLQSEQYADRTKLLLTGSPAGQEAIRRQLARRCIGQAITIKVGPLGDADAQHLAASRLPGAPVRFAEELARAASGSPILIRLGARILAQKATPIAALPAHEDLKTFALESLAEDIEGRLGSTYGPRLLELLAILAPVQPGDLEFVAKSAEFLRVQKYEVVQMLGRLEASGALRRWGSIARLDPEMVADFLVERACITQTGSPSGYAEEVLQAGFPGRYTAHLLRNIAECEWRANHTGRQIDLAGPAWASLTSIGANDDAQAAALLESVEQAAAYLPERALDLAFSLELRCTGSTAVRAAVARVLRQVAFSLEHAHWACDLLWRIGRNDPRRLNSHPDHALRVLQEVASYNGKPLLYNDVILASAERWVREPDLDRLDHSPLDILDKLLEKHGELWETKGFTLRYGGFSVANEEVRAIWRRAFAAVERMLHHESRKIVARALDSLAHAAVMPEFFAGWEVPASDIQFWAPERRQALDSLAQLTPQLGDAALALQCERRFRWFAHDAPEADLRRIAADALASIPRSLDLDIARCLCYADGDLAEDYAVARQKTLDNTSRRLLTEVPRERIAERLERVIAGLLELASAWVAPSDPGLLAEVGRADPEIGFALVGHIATHDGCVLRRYVAAALDPLRIGPEAERALAFERGLAHGESPDIQLAISWAYYAGGWMRRLNEHTKAVVRTLAASSDAEVRRRAIGSLKWLRSDSVADEECRQHALALALSFEIGAAPELAEALCEALDPGMGVPLTAQDRAAVAKAMERLEPVPDVPPGCFHVARVVAQVAAFDAEIVTDFFLRRIRRAIAAASEGTRFDALPFALRNTFSGVDVSAELLQRTLVPLASENAFERYLATKLAAMLDPSFSGRKALVARLANERLQTALRSAALLLSEAPVGLVFSERDFCAGIIEAAAGVSNEAESLVCSALAGTALSGPSQGIPGEPSPHYSSIRGLAREAAAACAAMPRVAKFYNDLAQGAQHFVDRLLAHDEELLYEQSG